MKINLNNKNKEIFENIDIKYRDLVINSLLTKDYQSGNLLKELSFYMSTSELELILSELQIEHITIKKERKYYSKNKKQQSIKKELDSIKANDNEVESLFIGFDK